MTLDPTYRIHGRIVPKEEFDRFITLIETIGGKKAPADIADDQHVIHTDIVVTLDRDGNGALHWNDFLLIKPLIRNPELFEQLDSFLEKYGFTRNYGGDVKHNLLVANAIIENLRYKLDKDKDSADRLLKYSVGNPIFSKLAVEANFNAIDFIDPALRQEIWGEILDDLTRRGVRFDRNMIGTFDDFKKYLAKNGIRFTGRLRSVQTALTLIHNRQTLSSKEDRRPIALMLYNTRDVPKEKDKAPAFEVYPLVDRFVTSGKFRVLYYEVSDEQAFHSARREVVRLSGRKIHTLVEAGHGQRGTLALGVDHCWDVFGVSSDSCIDLYDFDDGDFDDLPSQMEENGQVLLYACSNGEGRESEDNLANRHRELLPGRKILSHPSPINIKDLRIHDDLSMELELGEDVDPYRTIGIPGTRSQWGPGYREGLQVGISGTTFMGFDFKVDEGALKGSHFTGSIGGDAAVGLRLGRHWYLGAVIPFHDVAVEKESPNEPEHDVRTGIVAEGRYYVQNDDYSGRPTFFNPFFFTQAGTSYYLNHEEWGIPIAGGVGVSVNLSRKLGLPNRLGIDFFVNLRTDIPAGDWANFALGGGGGLGLTYFFGKTRVRR